jgi:Rod binding domain-containing protein
MTSSGGEVRNTDDAGLSAVQQDEQKKRIGKDFESVLLTKLFDQVQASIEDSGFDDEDSGAQQVRGMFWLYLAQDVADKGGFGLWKDIYQHMKQMEGSAGSTASVDEEG